MEGMMSATKVCSLFRSCSTPLPCLLKRQPTPINYFFNKRKASLTFPSLHLCSASLQDVAVIEDPSSTTPEEVLDITGNQSVAVIEDPFSATSEEVVDITGNQSAEYGPQAKVKLVLEKECHFGEQFYVVGNHPILGDWNVDAAIPMDWSEGHIWSTEVDVPVGKTLEFKYIRKGENLDLEWQAGSNRKFQTIEGVSLVTVNEPWESLESVDSILEELIDFKDSIKDSIDTSEEIVNTRHPTKDIANASDLVEEIANASDLVEEITNASNLVEEIANASDLVEEIANASDLVEEIANASDLVEEVANVSGLVEKIAITNEPSKQIANKNDLPNHIANTVDSSNDILDQSEPNGPSVSLDAINSNGVLGGDVIEAVVGEAGDAKINGESSVLEKDVIETGIVEAKDAKANGQVSVLEEDVIEEAAYTNGILKLQTTIAMAEDSNGSLTSVSGTTETEIVAEASGSGNKQVNQITSEVLLGGLVNHK